MAIVIVAPAIVQSGVGFLSQNILSALCTSTSTGGGGASKSSAESSCGSW